MKVAVMGAGGLGGFYGGMLARAGEEVHFIARGAHLQAMRSDGLGVESRHVGDFHLESVSATDDPGSIGPVNLVLMGVKSYDLEDASGAILPLLEGDGFVVPMLNGVDNAERIGAVTGMEKVVGGVVFASSNITAPGRVRHELDAPFLFGELLGGRSPRCDALEAVFHNAGVNAAQSERIRTELWHKYTLVSPLATVCAVVRLPTRAMAAQPEARSLYERLTREVEAVGRASGVEMDEGIVERVLGMIDSMGTQHTVSMLLDLRAGKRLELEAMVGTLVRLGEQLGVPTPVAGVLYLALKPHEHGPPRFESLSTSR